MKIIHVTISPLTHQPLVLPQVRVTYENDTSEVLFEYYPDEINFTADELIGLTRDQALELRTKKDIAYLQS